MKTVSPPRLSLVVLLAITSAAHAAPITGSINFSSGAGGGIIFQDSAGNLTTSLAAATGIQSWLIAEVEEGSGSFDSVPDGASVLFSVPWVFNPSTPKTPLWTIAGPQNFSFNLASSTIAFQNQYFLAIKGIGTLTATGFDPTPGTWFFTTQGAAAESKFSWSSSTVAVPDGVTTIALLGGSLLGVCCFHRRLGSRRSKISQQESDRSLAICGR